MDETTQKHRLRKKKSLTPPTDIMPASIGEAPGVVQYRASIYQSSGKNLPPPFCSAILELEALLEMPVWFLVQQPANADSEFNAIGPTLAERFFQARKQISSDGPVALVIHSLGGYAFAAYGIARQFQLDTAGLTVIVPRHAKSAATLLALGGKEIIFGPHAELGPLDAQMFDPDREHWTSALDEVKALDRLHASAQEAVDQLVIALLARTQKKIDNILPAALSFVAETVKPLVAKIDTIHLTMMSRILKEAEEYAKRLLCRNYRSQNAEKIATTLVEEYPTHSFKIDVEEATRMGINARQANGEVADAIDHLIDNLENITAIGRLEKVVAK
jgi:hypothetical protein